MKARAFETELKAAGFSVERTKKGHFNVINAKGNVIVNYSVGHGSNKNEVLDCYLRQVRKAVKEDQEQ